MELVTKSVDRFEREYYDVEGLNELTLRAAADQIVEYYKSNNTTGAIDTRADIAFMASFGGAYYIGGKLKWYIVDDVKDSRIVTRASAIKHESGSRVDFTLYVK